MKEMKLKVKLEPGAKMPVRAHRNDGGLDLHAMYKRIIPAGGSMCFDTGVHMEIPEGYVGFLKSKSGLNVNFGISGEGGVIDCGYTGSIMVKLYNHSKASVEIERGQKISQLVILPIATPELYEVDELDETERGNGGFGSTGAF